MQKQLRIALVALIVSSAICMGSVGRGLALQVGEKAPLFDLPSTTGTSLKLADYLGKQPVVLFFYIGAFTKT